MAVSSRNMSPPSQRDDRVSAPHALGAAGAVEVGESPAATLARELAEEWGLEPERLGVQARCRAGSRWSLGSQWCHRHPTLSRTPNLMPARGGAPTLPAGLQRRMIDCGTWRRSSADREILDNRKGWIEQLAASRRRVELVDWRVHPLDDPDPKPDPDRPDQRSTMTAAFDVHQAATSRNGGFGPRWPVEAQTRRYPDASTGMKALTVTGGQPGFAGTSSRRCARQRLPENRGVAGSIPALAIFRSPCIRRSFSADFSRPKDGLTRHVRGRGPFQVQNPRVWARSRADRDWIEPRRRATVAGVNR